jgi:hypothetical protein
VKIAHLHFLCRFVISRNTYIFAPKRHELTVFISDTNSRHPLLELNLQRPVYRNYRLLMNGTLFISKVEETDEGKFLCEADNGVNEALGKVVHLKVNGE